MPTKSLPRKIKVPNQQQRQQKVKAKYLTKDILSSNNRCKNVPDPFEEYQIDGETYVELDKCENLIRSGNKSDSYKEQADGETCIELDICDAKINKKETQTEFVFENRNQLKIIELEKKLLLLKNKHEKYIKQLQDTNSLNASISKIFTEDQLKRLRDPDPNKKRCWTSEDIYSTISSHLSLLFSQQHQQEQQYPHNLHQSSPKSDQNLPTNIKSIVNICNNDRTSNSNKSKFKCDQCNMIFNSKSTHTRHVKSAATQLRKQQQCNQKSQQHDRSSNKRTNSNSLMPKSPSKSSSSSSSPSSSTAISRISSIGGDSGPYQCKVCQKTYALRYSLQRHNRLHTGERLSECEFCHKMFSHNGNLQVHRRIHTKELPFQCDKCDKKFEHGGKLNRHMKIHTGERPHKCSFCDKTFIRSDSLIAHLRAHTGQKPFKCLIEGCGKCFRYSRQLKSHSCAHRQYTT